MITFEMTLALERAGVPYSNHRHYSVDEREVRDLWNRARFYAAMNGDYIPIWERKEEDAEDV